MYATRRQQTAHRQATAPIGKHITGCVSLWPEKRTAVAVELQCKPTGTAPRPVNTMIKSTDALYTLTTLSVWGLAKSRTWVYGRLHEHGSAAYPQHNKAAGGAPVGAPARL